MKKRLISAIIILLIVLPLLIFGGIFFRVCMSIIGTLAIKEILDIKKQNLIIKIISYLLVSILIFLNINILQKILIILFVYFILMIFIDDNDYNIESCSYLSIFSILTTSIFSYVCLIRENDIYVILYLISITILTDTFAYIGGKIFGKNKLIEKISPNKTIEGSIVGSLFGTIFPTFLYIYMISPGSDFMLIVLLTLILSVIGQLGDLVFSAIKRHYKIKDFSNLIPGHGGILDRLDSIIFVILGYVIYLNII